MSDVFYRIAISFALILFGASTALAITGDRYKLQLDTVELVTTAEKIDSYNAGYRAGKLEAVAELVECDGVRDQNVVNMYTQMSDILMGLGELDTAPFPCNE